MCFRYVIDQTIHIHAFINCNFFLVEDKMEVSGESKGCNDEEMDETFAPRLRTRPHFPNQRELDDLTKSGAELLASRLNEWNLLGGGLQINCIKKAP